MDSVDEVDQPPRWLPGPSWPAWAHFLPALSVIAPIAALLAAIGAKNIWGPAVAGAIGGGGGSWLQNKPYRRLSREDRFRVWQATRTGRPTGVATLDAIAIDRLTKASRNPRSDVILGWVLAAIVCLAPVMAAIRVSPWWLLAAIPGSYLIAVIAIRPARPDPASTLLRLREALTSRPG